MKNALLLFLLIASPYCFAQDIQGELVKENYASQQKDDLKSYFSQNVNFTEYEMKAIEGSMIRLVLIVDEEGAVPEAYIQRGAENCESCKEKIIQTAKSIQWEPATSDGEPVMVKYTIPLRF